MALLLAWSFAKVSEHVKRALGGLQCQPKNSSAMTCYDDSSSDSTNARSSVSSTTSSAMTCCMPHVSTVWAFRDGLRNAVHPGHMASACTHEAVAKDTSSIKMQLMVLLEIRLQAFAQQSA